MAKNIGIKCTYNDGDEGIFVGFKGTCSENTIKRNIEQGRVWCSQKECECRKYYDKGFKGKRPIQPCMESVLFRDWEFGAGTYHTGVRAGTPIHLSNVGVGKIAILTTRFPGDKEIDRKIIGFFKIGKVNNRKGETRLIADEHFRIRLQLEEAKQLYFWDYYSTKGGAKWGPGLIRYLNDETVLSILKDLRKTIRDEEAKLKISKLIEQDFKGIEPAPLSGLRDKKRENRDRRIAIMRKYGPGGEGPAHKKLKNWIANNPNEIGITDVIDKKVEYCFPSGDVADILFRCNGNKEVVVEIETVDPLPGCYQALKYKILRCAELQKDINTPEVETVLVAWIIPEEVKDFCDRYGIKYFQKTI